MERKVYLGTMGGPKVGKTHFAVSLFTSKYVDPERVLYFDNHGSTDPFPGLPQYTTKQRFGVVHLAADKPATFVARVQELRRAFNMKVYHYDAIVVDDWSEYAQSDIDERLDGADESKVPRSWGQHGDVLRSVARLLHPAVTHAHHIAVFQAAQLPDPLVPRPQNFNTDGHPIYTADTRPTKMRPFLQGSFAAWFPYKLDALFYQARVQKGAHFEFKMQLVPSEGVAVESRWLSHWVHDPKRPKELVDPTFDKVWEMIQSFTPEGAEPKGETESG